MSRLFYYAACLLAYFLPISYASGQQGSYNYFYRNNWQLVNPAAIDRSHYLTKKHPTMVVNAGSRVQWIGLEGAPLLYFVSAEYCPEERRSLPSYKIGISAFGDRTDAISTYGLYGNYSYYFVLPWGYKHSLHLGGSIGFIQYGVNLNRIRSQHIADDITLQSNQNRTFADFALGVLYRVQKRMYFGFSSPQTFGLNLIRDKNYSNKIGLRQVNFTGGWFIPKGAREYTTNYDENYVTIIEPSFIVRYAPGLTYSTTKFLKGSPFSADINLRIHHKLKYWYGGGLSTNGTVNLEGGIKRTLDSHLKMFFGAGYTIPVFQRYQSLGHSVEVNFGYYFR